MFRVWGKIMKDNRLVRDYTACIDDSSLTRTSKVYKALDMICYELNISHPIWLPLNQKDFIRFSRTKFTKDSFIEEIDFDYLDFHLIEE